MRCDNPKCEDRNIYNNDIYFAKIKQITTKDEMLTWYCSIECLLAIEDDNTIIVNEDMEELYKLADRLELGEIDKEDLFESLSPTSLQLFSLSITDTYLNGEMTDEKYLGISQRLREHYISKIQKIIDVEGLENG